MTIIEKNHAVSCPKFLSLNIIKINRVEVKFARWGA